MDRALNAQTAEAVSSEVKVKVITIMREVNPLLKFSNKTERKAIEGLVGLLGEEKAIRAAELAVEVSGEPYAPVITTPWELLHKLPKLVIFLRRREAEVKGVTI